VRSLLMVQRDEESDPVVIDTETPDLVVLEL
jgi:hypothetical protein